MKKKIIIIITAIFIIFIGSFIIIKSIHEKRINQEKARYNEIKNSVKVAVEKRIKAQYPYCPISYEWNDEIKERTDEFYQSSGLINNGYIKKSELLDVDNKSYCDVFVQISPYYENPLDQQHNCHVNYNYYLKCKNYEDKGYFDWGLIGNEYR